MDTLAAAAPAVVTPVVYGASDRPPRGDYSRGGVVQADYTCPQDWASYTPADHDTYKRLYERQAAQLPGLACDAFINALPLLGVKDRIPRFEEINERLHRATGWEIVAVPGLIPELPFFTLLANRKFPVTDWIRKPTTCNAMARAASRRMNWARARSWPACTGTRWSSA